MEEHLIIAAVAAFILLYGLVSGRLEKTIITAPMVFVLFGLLLSDVGWGLVDASLENELVNFIAEFTLILVLFSDASRIDLKRLYHEHNIPLRLLLVGLPLTVIFGAIAAALLFNFVSIWEAVILAIILTPTDAALGQAVVNSPRVPVRIRQALNVESGLNDGIALPFLLFFIAVAGEATTLNSGYWIGFGAKQIILGPLAGLAVGYSGGWLVSWAEQREWMAEAYQKLVALGLALLAFAVAELIGGNGFIAAFVAGITVGNLFRDVCGRLHEYVETEGQLLTLLTFGLYGAIMLLPALAYFKLNTILYAILSLTLVRMIPVAISLWGLRLQKDTLLFLGWFGPRGIASILYGLIILDELSLAGRHQIFAIMSITVLGSVFAHGMTALPAVNVYGSRAEAMKDESDMPELLPVSELPTRRI